MLCPGDCPDDPPGPGCGLCLVPGVALPGGVRDPSGLCPPERAECPCWSPGFAFAPGNAWVQLAWRFSQLFVLGSSNAETRLAEGQASFLLADPPEGATAGATCNAIGANVDMPVVYTNSEGEVFEETGGLAAEVVPGNVNAVMGFASEGINLLRPHCGALSVGVSSGLSYQVVESSGAVRMSAPGNASGYVQLLQVYDTLPTGFYVENRWDFRFAIGPLSGCDPQDASCFDRGCGWPPFLDPIIPAPGPGDPPPVGPGAPCPAGCFPLSGVGCFKNIIILVKCGGSLVPVAKTVRCDFGAGFGAGGVDIDIKGFTKCVKPVGGAGGGGGGNPRVFELCDDDLATPEFCAALVPVGGAAGGAGGVGGGGAGGGPGSASRATGGPGLGPPPGYDENGVPDAHRCRGCS